MPSGVAIRTLPRSTATSVAAGVTVTSKTATPGEISRNRVATTSGCAATAAIR